MNQEENEETRGCRKRGRPRIHRSMENYGPWRCYAPQCNAEEDAGSVSVLPEEIELLRLIDCEGMDQEEAAIVQGISRRTLWKDLHDIRMKIADALIHGKTIEVRDCKYRSEGSCPQENKELCPKGLQKLCVRSDRHKPPEQ